MYCELNGVATVREKSGKIKNFLRSGKSQGILQKVRENISVLVKVSEKSGNFVFRFYEVYEDIFIRKKRSCSRSSYAFKWRVFSVSQTPCVQNPVKNGEIEMKRRILIVYRRN